MRHYLADTEFEIASPDIDEIDGDELHEHLLALAESEGMILRVDGERC